MRTCIIHIGLHKTGTTAIQRTLFEHRRQLLAAGIDYPGIPGSTERVRAHHGLANDLGLRTKHRPFGVSDLARAIEASSAPYMVLSSEDLSSPVDPGKVADLIALIGRSFDKIRIAVVVRPQVDLYNSAYTHAVQTFGFHGPFRAFLAERLDRRAFELSSAVRPWALAETCEILAIPYQGDMIGTGISATLLLRAGIEADRVAAAGPLTTEAANTSAGRKGTAALRVLGERHPDWRQRPDMARLHQRAMRDLDRRGWNDEKFRGPDQAAAERIRATFADDNEAFAARYFGRPWDVVFAAETAKPWISNEIDLADADPALSREFEEFARTFEASESAEAARPESRLGRLARSLFGRG